MNEPGPVSEGRPSDTTRLEERRRAMRAILRKPLLLPDEPADLGDFLRVRRFSDELRDWFSRHTGWTLEIAPEFARLRKTPGDLRDGTRPALDVRGIPFSRRRYVLLCLTLAALARAERQTTLGRLANEVVNLWNHDSLLQEIGLEYSMELQEDRRDLVHVIRVLLLWQVLRRVDGTEDAFLHGRQDVLYSVRHILLARLLAVRRPPSLIAVSDFDGRLASLIEEPLAATEEQRYRRLRVTLVRRLLDDPVVYYDDLSSDELVYLQRQRAHIIKLLVDATGLEAEERAEGFALADPFGDCSDVGMPEEGTDGHVTILVAEFLATRHAAGETIIGFAAVEDFLAVQAKTHRRHWRRDAVLPGSERELAQAAIQRLAQLGLVARHESGIVLRPALHRFRLRTSEERDL